MAGIAELCDEAGSAMHYATDALMYADRDLVDDSVACCARVARRGAELEAGAALVLAAQAAGAGAEHAALTTLKDVVDLGRMASLAGKVVAVCRRRPDVEVPPSIRSSFAEMGRIAVGISTATASTVLSKDADNVRVVAAYAVAMSAVAQFELNVVNDTEIGNAAAVSDATGLGRQYERFAEYALRIACRAAHGPQARGSCLLCRLPGTLAAQGSRRCSARALELCAEAFSVGRCRRSGVDDRGYGVTRHTLARSALRDGHATYLRAATVPNTHHE